GQCLADVSRLGKADFLFRGVNIAVHGGVGKIDEKNGGDVAGAPVRIPCFAEGGGEHGMGGGTGIDKEKLHAAVLPGAAGAGDEATEVDVAGSGFGQFFQPGKDLRTEEITDSDGVGGRDGQLPEFASVLAAEEGRAGAQEGESVKYVNDMGILGGFAAEKFA